MRKYFIMHKIFEYVSRRKINFFLTTLITIVTLYMASMVIHMYAESVYYMVETRNVFSDEDILNIQIVMTEQESNDYFERGENFLKVMEETYGENFGKFMYLNVNYIVEGETNKLDTLYIDASAFDLCKVKFYKDETAEKLLKEDASLLPGFVSKSSLDKYPLGTILQNSNINTKTVIIGYFEDGSTWAPDLLLNLEATINLDNYIVSAMDNNYFDVYNGFYANTFSSIYVKMNSSQDINAYKDEIRRIARDSQIKCYIYSLDEMINDEKQGNKELMKAIGSMAAFAILVGLAGVLASYLADVGSWQKEIAIMYLNGVAPIDIYLIILMENFIKALLGLSIAFYIYGHKLSADDYRIYWSMVVPVLILSTLICVILFSYIAFKTVRQSKLLSIYGGSTL